jgi:hypothetical protein
MDLLIFNVVSVVVLFAVTIANIIFAVITHNKLQDQSKTIKYIGKDITDLQNDVGSIKSKLKADLKKKVEKQAISILDLQEFADLDPAMKNAYKKYIVDMIMPAIMYSINEQFFKNNVDKQLSMYDDEINEFVYSLASDIKKNGLVTVMKKVAADGGQGAQNP